MSRPIHDGPDLGLTADRSAVVLAESPESAFQLVASGSAVPSEFLDLYAAYVAGAQTSTDVEPDPEPEAAQAEPEPPVAETPKPKPVRRRSVKKS